MTGFFQQHKNSCESKTLLRSDYPQHRAQLQEEYKQAVAFAKKEKGKRDRAREASARDLLHELNDFLGYSQNPEEEI